MAKSTRATKALEQAGIAFTAHLYEYDPAAERVGLQAAEALGADPGHLFKTLMARVDAKPLCVIVPSNREVSMKKLAAAAGGKSAELMAPADAERTTGYKVGGISPFAQMRPAPAFLDEAALALEEVYINAGQRGLLLKLDPRAAAAFLSATVAGLCA